MIRILSAGVLLLVTTAAAQGQPVGPLAPPATDSLAALRLRAIREPSTIQVSRQLLPLTTIQPALSRVAGVQVTPYSGAPGAWSTVRFGA